MAGAGRHPVHPVQNPESFFPSAVVGQAWLAASLPPEVPMSPVELDGPANGCQPSRRVAMRERTADGTRR